MSAERAAWVFSVPSVVAWAIANAGRRVVPCEDGRPEEGDLVLIRAEGPKPEGYEAVEAYVGRSITNRPQAVVVATAVLSEKFGPMPEDQGRWSHAPGWLLSDVHILAQPVSYRRGGKVYKPSARILAEVRIQER